MWDAILYLKRLIKSQTTEIIDAMSGGSNPTGPLWTLVFRFQDEPSFLYTRALGPFRYWQFRVTLRANGL